MCRQQFKQATQCATQLYKRGFDVLAIRLDGRLPRIEIAHQRKCDRLGGVWYQRRANGAGVIYRMAVLMHGCQIEWEERRAS